jgi:hypothetical protein
MERANEGLSQSGGSIQAGAMAVGRGATASNVSNTVCDALREGGRGPIADRLDELLRALRDHAAELPDPDGIQGSADTVVHELARDEPNKITILGILSGIRDTVGSVSGIAAAAGGLMTEVRNLL